MREGTGTGPPHGFLTNLRDRIGYMKRSTRLLAVIGGLGSIASLAIAPQILPSVFDRESSLGYVAEYKSDLVGVWRGSRLSQETWTKVRHQCRPDEHRLVPVYVGEYTHEVFCRTKADRARSIFGYLAALLLFPALALLVGWILKGES